MARKVKKIEEEIDEFDDTESYDDYDDDVLESMVDEIVNGDPDDNVTVDNLHLIVEWIKRKI